MTVFDSRLVKVAGALAAGGALGAAFDSTDGDDSSGGDVGGVEAFAGRLAKYTAGSPEVTERRGHGEYVVDFRLAVAPDTPFRSSTKYIERRDRPGEVLNPTLRFADDVLDDYSIGYVRDEFEELVTDATGVGSGWSSYPMGDVGTGPHIVSHGRMDADDFVDVVADVVEGYRSRFDG